MSCSPGRRFAFCLLAAALLAGAASALMISQADAARIFIDADNNPATEETSVAIDSAAGGTQTLKVYLTDWEYAPPVFSVQFSMAIGDPSRVTVTPWTKNAADPTHPNCTSGTVSHGGPFDCDLSAFDGTAAPTYTMSVNNFSCTNFSDPMLIYTIQVNTTAGAPASVPLTFSTQQAAGNVIIPGGAGCADAQPHDGTGDPTLMVRIGSSEVPTSTTSVDTTTSIPSGGGGGGGSGGGTPPTSSTTTSALVPPPATSTTTSSAPATTTAPATSTTTSMPPQPAPLCPAEELYGQGSAEVALLRQMRDEVLGQSPAGQAVIRIYHRWAPAVAQAIRGDAAYKSMVKKMADALLALITRAQQVPANRPAG